MKTPNTAQLIGGVPSENTALFHRIRFSAGDPAAWILKPDGTSVLIIRDIEADRARRDAIVDAVQTPADHVPEGGLSGDRATATAQATAECLKAMKLEHVLVDRSTPFIYVHELIEAGLSVQYDSELGGVDRRSKSQDELSALQQAQSAAPLSHTVGRPECPKCGIPRVSPPVRSAQRAVTSCHRTN